MSAELIATIAAAIAALAPNTFRAYGSAWAAWQRWAAAHGRQAFPATAADVAAYLQARHAGGSAPATIRLARAAIAWMHLVSSRADPTAASSLCRDVLRRIVREGRDRGRGQVTGVGWERAGAAALLAEDAGSLQGLRDGAIIRLMSDTLARNSEVAALRCSDVEPEITAGGGTVHIRASKTDQRGEGSTRFIGPPTMAALERYQARAGHTTGPLFRRVLRGGHGSAEPLAAGSIGEIVRKRLRAVGVTGRLGGHSLRVGSARELAATGASVAELQQAGGWRSPATPEVYIRRETAARGPMARRRYPVEKDPEREPPQVPVQWFRPGDLGRSDTMVVLSFPGG